MGPTGNQTSCVRHAAGARVKVPQARVSPSNCERGATHICPSHACPGWKYQDKKMAGTDLGANLGRAAPAASFGMTWTRQPNE